MNCQKCQELMSDFLDGTLASADRGLLSAHFEECAACAGIKSDLLEIVLVAREAGGEYETPPNGHALWLRIRNTIESEPAAERLSPGAGTTWWSRLAGWRWELTLPQLTTAIAALIVAVALATVYSLRNFQKPPAPAEGPAVASAGNIEMAPQGMPQEAVMTTAVDGRFGQQQLNVSYWQQRVDQRRSRWNPVMRETFDRDMSVVDQALQDSLIELKRNPHDEVSEEMLNAAMRDKLDLLKQFSDL